MFSPSLRQSQATNSLSKVTLPSLISFASFFYLQVIVQRTLGAKNNIQAKAGSIFAGFLKILPIFIMVMPGMISRVLYPDSIGCADPISCKFHCDNEWGCSNNAYPK